MNCPRIGIHALWVALVGATGLVHAAPLPPDWEIVPSAAEAAERGVPKPLRSPELAMNGRRLPWVEIVVSLPFEQVLPAVTSALAAVGPLREEASLKPLSGIEEGWGKVLLARRPDLAQKLVREYDLPQLQQRVRDGVLAESEVVERLAFLERNLRFDSGGKRMASLTQPYKYWRGSARREHGVTHGSTSVVVARVMQLDPVLGHPATAVYLMREDDFPNPRGGFVGQMRALVDLNVFSSGPPKRLQRSLVPQELFSPVYEALSRLPNAQVTLAESAERWMPPARPAPRISEPKLTVPDTRGQVLQARALFEYATTQDMAVLADGSALFVRNHPQALVHWAPGDGDQPRVLWTPSASVTHWLLSRDPAGQSAFITVNGQAAHFDARSRRLVRHPLAFDQPERVDDSYVRYFNGGDGPSMAYRHDYRGDYDTFNLWLLVSQPQEEGALWKYALRFASPRQDAMKDFKRGNLQIKPVRWDGPFSNVWIEDSYGLAELDGQNGHVLRVVRLPRRFGEADPGDDSGMAQWTPQPFGSVRGGWIAVGFVLMKGQRRNPGMHVVDIKTGKVRYSLTLPGEDSLNAAAGSPDGRLLALGTGSPNDPAVVWNLDTGRSLTLQSRDVGCRDLQQLQWSPAGDRLWGRCADGVVVWDVPEKG